jgi:hypothetical protein
LSANGVSTVALVFLGIFIFDRSVSPAVEEA